MNYRDTVSGTLFLVAGLVTAGLGWDYYADASYVPVGVGIAMSLLALTLIVRCVRSQTNNGSAALLSHAPRFFITLITCVVYFIALPFLGFYTASTLFVLGLALMLGERRPLPLLSILVVFIVLLYMLFALLLKRPLPPEFFLAS